MRRQENFLKFYLSIDPLNYNKKRTNEYHSKNNEVFLKNNIQRKNERVFEIFAFVRHGDLFAPRARIIYT